MTYIVKHSAVGLIGRTAKRDDKLSDADLEGLDIERLLKVGAIEAVKVTVVPAPTQWAFASAEQAEKPLAKKSLDELRTDALRLGIEVEGRTKAELREAIEAASASADQADPEGDDADGADE